MKYIKLKGKYGLGNKTKVDDDVYIEQSQYDWHLSKVGYVIRSKRVNGKVKTYYLHNVIMETPKGFVTDHINRNKLDNRRTNLKVCTQSENNLNKKTRGYYYDKINNKWYVKYKQKYFGRVNTEAEAKAIVREYAKIGGYH